MSFDQIRMQRLREIVHDLYIDLDVIENLLLRMNKDDEWDQLQEGIDQITRVFMKMEVYKDGNY